MIERTTRLACRCAALLFIASPLTTQAQADADAWLVLPVVAGEELPDAARQLAESASTALADRHDEVVAPRALTDFGSAPQALPTDLQERLAATVHPALEDAAFGRRARVVEVVNPLLDEVGRYLDALGDRTVAARAVADLALIAARVHIENRDEHAGRASIERLLSLVPSPEPTVDYHEHAVLALLSRVRSRLREGGSNARLTIESDDAGSCNAYVNGQLAGPTPLTVPVYSGNYAVRVQCGEARSRVHLVSADTGEVTVTVSASLEAAVRQQPELHLHYAEAAALAARARADAARLADRLGASRVLLIRADESEAHLEALQRDGHQLRPLRSATVSLPPGDDLGATWAALLGGGPPPQDAGRETSLTSRTGSLAARSSQQGSSRSSRPSTQRRSTASASSVTG